MRRLLATAGLALLSGCCNIVTRPERAHWACAPYECTTEVAKTLAVPFQDPKGPEGGIAQAYVTLLYPVILVSLPCDAVVDTVFLPWDFGFWLGTRR
jgi:uncharacterized protein YceK